MIRENSIFRISWDFLILLLIPISCILVPFYSVFELLGEDTLLFIYLIDAIYIADIVLNFFTTFTPKGGEPGNRKEVAFKYLSTFFIFDLLANIPIIYSHEVDTAHWLLIFPAFRLLRLVRLFAILKRWNNTFWKYTSVLRILKFLIVMIVVIHWISSAWFFIAKLDGFSAQSWIIASGFIRVDAISDYIYSLYWTIITMTTVGYGDITPVRNIEFVFTMITALLGASSYAFIIGNVASLLNNMNAAKSAYFNKIQAINQYLHQRNLPTKLNDSVREYYHYLWSSYKGHAETDFLDDIPLAMRLDIMKHLAKDFMANIPLFKNASESLKNALLLALQHQTYPPNCKVIQEGEPGREIFFIAKGELEINTASGKKYPKFTSGDYFGEMSLLLQEIRTASLKTTTFCDVYCLTQKDYLVLKKEYPEFKELLKLVSVEQNEKRSELILDNIIL